MLLLYVKLIEVLKNLSRKLFDLFKLLLSLDFWHFVLKSPTNLSALSLSALLAYCSLRYDRNELVDFFSWAFNTDVISCVNGSEKKSFCESQCPARNVPTDYPNCRPHNYRNNVDFSRNEILCINLCYEKMAKIYANNAAWWEFWIRAPTDEEIYKHSRIKLQQAERCLDLALFYRKSNVEEHEAFYAADAFTNWGMTVSVSIFIFVLIINFIAIKRL